MNLSVKDLTPDAFAPYGTVIEQPDVTPEASGPGWNWWSETTLLPHTDRGYGIGYLSLRAGPLRFDWAERHMHSPEVIVPLGDACLVYVGRPEEAPDWERFEVFRIRQGQAVVLNEGVWHGAPLALNQDVNALVFLRKGAGAEDVHKESRLEGPVNIAPSNDE